MRSQARTLISALLVVAAPAVAQEPGQGAEGEERFLQTAAEARPGTCVSPDELSVKPLSAARSFSVSTSERALAAASGEPMPVRHDVPRPDEGFLTLRYWRLERGSYDEFWRLSAEGLWPFFEKMGARIVGTWRVVVPPGGEEAGMREHPDYEEVYMLVRYASFEHWQATRDMAGTGGNGPDFLKARAAAAARRPMVLDSWVTFLEGHQWHDGPVFTPPLDERYELVE